MVALKRSEIRTIENFVAKPNGLGYVLEFSDRTFAEWFEDEFRFNINDARYSNNGTSKRHRLISFCVQEEPYMVAKVLRALLSERARIFSGKDDPDDLKLGFERIAYCIEQAVGTPSTDGINAYEANKTLDELVQDIERNIGANKPEVALDHLHTYCMKKFAYLLSLEGIRCDSKEALHARFGKYRKTIADQHNEHPITDLALKSSITVLERFNDVRNNWSLAHDNEILAHAEARYIFETITALLRLVKALEADRYEN